MKSIIFCFLIVIGTIPVANAQGVGIGTNNPSESAILDVSSNIKGTLLTRMTSVQRKAIVSPALGLLVYDTDKKTLYMYDGGEWRPLMFGISESALPPIPLAASDGAADDQFGTSVDIDGDYAIVGAPGDKIVNHLSMGSAYIFKRTNGVWSQQAKIIAVDADGGKLFGSSVSISGDYAIVGAPRDTIGTNEDQGSAYIYVRTGDTWVQQAKLVSSDGSAEDRFGSSVSIDGAYAVVGAPRNTVGTLTGRGSAYIFLRNSDSWTQQYHLSPVAGASNDNFGTSVEIDGSYVIIGAPHDDASGRTDNGCAYIFSRIGGLWSQQAQLIPSSASSYDSYGSSVSISGSSVIIGNPAELGAYIFVRNGSVWTEQASIGSNLTGGPQAHGKSFSVSISGDIAVIGDPAYTVNGALNQGRVWVYKRALNTWTLLRTIDDGNPEYFELFGWSVCISDGDVFIGATEKNSKGGIFITNVQ